MKKLRSKKGETLAETLVSLVIIMLAASMLFTMIGASSRLTKKAEAADTAFYAELSQAEEGTNYQAAQIELFLGTKRESLPALITGNENELHSYRVEVSP